MRLKNRLSPYPILFDYRDDYIKSTFAAEIEASVHFSDIEVSVRFMLKDDVLSEMIHNGQAVFLIHVECPSVSFRAAHTNSELNCSFKLDSNNLKERFEICTFIVANTLIKEYSNPNFHSDYNGLSFDIDKGQLLAIGTAKKFDIKKTNDRLENLPSIFRIQRLKDSSAGAMTVNTDNSDYICIGLTQALFERYVSLGKRIFKDTAFSLILLPALVVVLTCMRENSAELRDCNWYKVIEELLLQNNYSVEELDIYDSKKSVLAVAQAIFGDPLKRSLCELELIAGRE